MQDESLITPALDPPAGAPPQTPSLPAAIKPTPAPDIPLDDAIDKIADHFEVPRDLWRAMVNKESGGNVNVANSQKGARGLFQIMPATAANLKKPNGQPIDPNDPVEAAYGGLKLLSDNYKRFRPLAQNDRHAWGMAIAGYHGSPANVLKDLKAGGTGIPDQDDGSINTQDHVYKILKNAPNVGRTNASPTTPTNGNGQTPPVVNPQGRPLPQEGSMAGALHLNDAIAPKVPAGAARPFAPGEWVSNPDGSWSSEITQTVEGDPNFNGGKPTVIPGMWLVNGKPQRVNEDQATAYAKASGLNFPSFNSLDEAEKFANDRETLWQGVKPQEASKVPPLWSSNPSAVAQPSVTPEAGAAAPTLALSNRQRAQAAMAKAAGAQPPITPSPDPAVTNVLAQQSDEAAVDQAFGQGVHARMAHLKPEERDLVVKNARAMNQVNLATQVRNQSESAATQMQIERARQRQAQVKRAQARATMAQTPSQIAATSLPSNEEVTRRIQSGQPPYTPAETAKLKAGYRPPYGQSQAPTATPSAPPSATAPAPSLLPQTGAPNLTGIATPQPGVTPDRVSGRPVRQPEVPAGTLALPQTGTPNLEGIISRSHADTIGSDDLQARNYELATIIGEEQNRSGPSLAPLDTRIATRLGAHVAPELSQGEQFNALERIGLNRDEIKALGVDVHAQRPTTATAEGDTSGRTTSEKALSETLRTLPGYFYRGVQKGAANLDQFYAGLAGIASHADPVHFWQTLHDRWSQEGQAELSEAQRQAQEARFNRLINGDTADPDLLDQTVEGLGTAGPQLLKYTGIALLTRGLGAAPGLASTMGTMGIVSAIDNGDKAVTTQVGEFAKNVALGAVLHGAAKFGGPGVAGRLRSAAAGGAAFGGAAALQGEPVIPSAALGATLGAVMPGTGEAEKAISKNVVEPVARAAVRRPELPEPARNVLAKIGGFGRAVFVEDIPTPRIGEGEGPRALAFYKDPQTGGEGGTEVDAATADKYAKAGQPVVRLSTEQYQQMLDRVRSVNPEQAEQLGTTPVPQSQLPETASPSTGLPRASAPPPRTAEEVAAPDIAREQRVADEQPPVEPRTVNDDHQKLLDAIDRANKAGDGNAVKELIKRAQEAKVPSDDIDEALKRPSGAVTPPTPETPRVPELPETIKPQVEAMMAGRRPAVILPQGYNGPLPAGVGRVVGPQGQVAIFREDRVTPEFAQHLLDTDQSHFLTGMPNGETPDATVAAVARDAKGTERMAGYLVPGNEDKFKQSVATQWPDEKFTFEFGGKKVENKVLADRQAPQAEPSLGSVAGTQIPAQGQSAVEVPSPVAERDQAGAGGGTPAKETPAPVIQSNEPGTERRKGDVRKAESDVTTARKTIERLGGELTKHDAGWMVKWADGTFQNAPNDAALIAKVVRPMVSASTKLPEIAASGKPSLEQEETAKATIKGKATQPPKPWADARVGDTVELDGQTHEVIARGLREVKAQQIADKSRGNVVPDGPKSFAVVRAIGDKTPLTTPVVEYKKTEPVQAEVSEKPFEWKTKSGQTMQAEAGDYKVTHPNGRTGSVKPDVFKASHKPVEGKPGWYMKTGTTKAQQLDRPLSVTSLEGPVSGKAGDYLITGAKNEQYIVGKSEFEGMYKPVGEKKEVAAPSPAGSMNEMNPFPAELGSLGVPRAAMPQVDMGHRGALVNFLQARGISADVEEVAPNKLKPSQADYNPAKVLKAKQWVGPERKILISSDSHVVDGHHQWYRKYLDAPDTPIPVIRLGLPAQALLMQVSQFPSSYTQGTHHTSEKGPAVPDTSKALTSEPEGFRHMGGPLSERLYREMFRRLKAGGPPAEFPEGKEPLFEQTAKAEYDAGRIKSWKGLWKIANPTATEAEIPGQAEHPGVIGKPIKMLDVDAVLEKQEVVDGVHYELYHCDPMGIVRTLDEDSHRVIEIIKYPTYADAQVEYDHALETAREEAEESPHVNARSVSPRPEGSGAGEAKPATKEEGKEAPAQVEAVPEGEKPDEVAELQAAFDKFDDTGESTFADLVNDVESIAIDASNPAISSLTDAVETVREEQRQHAKQGYRLDGPDEDTFIAAIQKALKQEEPHAIRERSSKGLHVREAPGDSGEVGARVSGPGTKQPAVPQGGQETSKGKPSVAPGDEGKGKESGKLKPPVGLTAWGQQVALLSQRIAAGAKPEDLRDEIEKLRDQGNALRTTSLNPKAKDDNPKVKRGAELLIERALRANPERVNDLSVALDKFAHLKASNTPIGDYLNQRPLFGDELDLTPEQKNIVQAFDNVPVGSLGKFVTAYLGDGSATEAVVASKAETKESQGALFANRPKTDARFQIAWHGSPHEFDKFSLEHFGSGEGAASYGAGLYFTDRKEIADFYRSKLADRPTVLVDGGTAHDVDVAARLSAEKKARDSTTPISDAEVVEAVAERIDSGMRAAKEAKDFTLYERLADQKAALARMKDRGITFEQKGRTYQVELAPKDDEYLLWDKPLARQSEKVQKALSDAGHPITPNTYPSLKQARTLFESDRVQYDARSDIGIRESLQEGWKMVQRENEQGFRDWFDQDGSLLSPGRRKDSTGERFYEDLWHGARLRDQGPLGAAAMSASKYLHSIGVRGIKYLDEGSRLGGAAKYEARWSPDEKFVEVYERKSKELVDQKFDTFKEADQWIASHADKPTFNYVLFSDDDVAIEAMFAARGWDTAEPSPTEDPEFTVEGNQIHLNLAGADLLTAAYRLSQQADEIPPQGIAGAHESSPESLARTLEIVAENEPDRAEHAIALAQAVREAGKDGTVRLDSGGPYPVHEAVHEASLEASGHAALDDRHPQSGFDRMEAMPQWKTIHDALTGRGYKDIRASLMEEAMAHLASGDNLGLPDDQANEFMEAWFRSFTEKNGHVSIKRFKELTNAAEQARDKVYSEAEARQRGDVLSLQGIADRGQEGAGVAHAEGARGVPGQTEGGLSEEQAIAPSSDLSDRRRVLRGAVSLATDTSAARSPREATNLSDINAIGDRGSSEGVEIVPEMGATTAALAATRQTDTPEFRKWFGKSVVVDDSGEPLIVHHGDLREDPKILDPNAALETEGVVFFTDNPDVAHIFRFPREYGEVLTSEYDEESDEDVEIEPGASVDSFLRIENPYILEGAEAQRASDDTGYQGQVVRKAKAEGYDGVIFRNVDEGVGDWTEEGTTYGIFSATQVKSASRNRGTFDPNNPNILFALKPKEEEEPYDLWAHLAQLAEELQQSAVGVEFPQGIKNAITELERTESGRDPLEREARRAIPGIFDEAVAELDPRKAQILAQSIVDDPRNLSPEETAQMIAYKVWLKNLYADAGKALASAQDTHDIAAEQIARIQLAQLDGDLDVYHKMGIASGYEWGLTGRVRQEMLKSDYSIEMVKTRARAFEGGPLSAELEQRLADLVKERDELLQKVADYDEKASQKAMEAEIRRQKQAEERKQKVLEQQEEKTSGRRARTVQRVITKQEVSVKLQSLAERYQKYRAAKALDLSANPFLVDPELLDIAKDMFEVLIQSGANSVAEILDPIYDILKDEGSKRELNDALADYGKVGQLSLEEIDVRRREIKRLMRADSALADIEEERKLPARSGVPHDKPTQREREMRKKINAALRKFGLEIERNDTRTPEERQKSALDAMHTRLRNRIEDLKSYIAGGERAQRQPGPEPDELAVAMKAEIKELEEALAEIEGPTELSYEQKVSIATRAVEKALAEHERMIAEGDIEPHPQTVAVWEAELGQLKRRDAALVDQIKEMRQAANAPAQEQQRLERELASIREDITAKQEQIRTGNLAPATKAAPRPSTPAIEAAKAERADLNKQIAKLRQAAGAPSREQRRLEKEQERLDKRIAALEAEAQGGSTAVKTPPTPKPATPQITASRAQVKILNKVLAKIRRDAQPKKTPAEVDASNRLRLRRYLEKRDTELQRMLDTKNYAKKKRPPPLDDPALRALRTAVKRKEEQIDLENRKIDLANRTNWQKFWQHGVGVRRAVGLSSTFVIGKLTAAATARIFFSIGEEIVGAPLPYLPIIGTIARQAPSEGYLNLDAEFKHMAAAYSKEMREQFAQVLKTGKMDIDVLHGKKEENETPHIWYEYIGHMHAALKTPAKFASFERYLAKNLAWLQRHGYDPTDEGMKALAAARAVIDANRAILQQDNVVSTTFRRIVNFLETKKYPNHADRRKAQIQKHPALATVLKLMFFVTKVPPNFLREAISYTPAGLAITTVQILKAVHAHGISALTEEAGGAPWHGGGGAGVPPRGLPPSGDPWEDETGLPRDEADEIIRGIKKGLFGSPFMVLAVLSALGLIHFIQFGGYYQKGEKRKKGDVPAGGIRILGFDLPTWATHVPLLEAMQATYTALKVYEAYRGENKARADAALHGVLAAGKGMLQELPFYEEPARAIAAVDEPETWAQYFGGLARGFTLPPDLQRAARTWDPSEPTTKMQKLGEMIGFRKGEPTKRKPLKDSSMGTRFIQEYESGVPGLRERVPVNEAKVREELKDKYVDALRAGKPATSDIERDIAAGKLLPGDKKSIADEASLTQLQFKFKSKNVVDAMKLFENYSDAQQDEVRQILINKGPDIKTLRVTEQDAARAKFEELTDKNPRARRRHPRSRRWFEFYKQREQPSPPQ